MAVIGLPSSSSSWQQALRDQDQARNINSIVKSRATQDLEATARTKKLNEELSEWKGNAENRKKEYKLDLERKQADIDAVNVGIDFNEKQLEKLTQEAADLEKESDNREWHKTFGGVQLNDPESYAVALENATEEQRAEAPTLEEFTNDPMARKTIGYLQKAVINTISHVQEEAMAGARTSAKPSDLKLVNMYIPDGEGGYSRQQVYKNVDPNSPVATLDSNKNPIVLPAGSYEESTGATQFDKPASLKGVSASDVSMLDVASTQLEWAKEQLYNRDGSVNRANLFNAAINLPLVNGKGVPGTEGRTLASNLGSAASTALFIRSGKQSRVDEKADVYTQLIPSVFDSNQTIGIKVEVLTRLVNGSLDIMGRKKDGEDYLDIDKTLLRANQVLQARQEAEDESSAVKSKKNGINYVTTPGGYLVPQVGAQ